MSQKLKFPIVGPEPIKFGSKMPNFELKSQYLGHIMPRRGYFASITSNWFIGGLHFLNMPVRLLIISYLQADF